MYDLDGKVLQTKVTLHKFTVQPNPKVYWGLALPFVVKNCLFGLTLSALFPKVEKINFRRMHGMLQSAVFLFIIMESCFCFQNLIAHKAWLVSKSQLVNYRYRTILQLDNTTREISRP